MSAEIQDKILASMEALNGAFTEQRKLDDQIKGMKAEIATLNTRLAVETRELNPAEFSSLVGSYLDAW